jgi:hypothetical protein
LRKYYGDQKEMRPLSRGKIRLRLFPFYHIAGRFVFLVPEMRSKKAKTNPYEGGKTQEELVEEVL